MSHKRWFPLEANPEVLNHYSSVLGLDTSKNYFFDVYGLDAEMLSFVPGPVLAVLLLFPIDERAEQFKQEEEQRIEREGQILSPAVYFMNQTIGNACGTVALLHAIFNNMSNLTTREESFLSKFYNLSQDMTPMERAELLERPKEGQPDIEHAHQEAAESGETRTPGVEEKVTLHFVCLAEKDGGLYELDGRKKFPIYHGPTSPVTLLRDSVPVIQAFMKRSASIEFNIMSLA